ncbi:S41 family peptidase [Sphingomonas ginsenosidivorax]|nr:S41 family peptidase [Sphingomonas ginsenosidivorax]
MPTTDQAPWREMARIDLDFATALIRSQYIGAVYPDPASFAKTVEAARMQALRDLPKVGSFAGYRALLKRFINSFDDEHIGISFFVMQSRLSWPGFLATYQGHRYLTSATSGGDIHDGSEITSCDGVPVETWVERIAQFEGGHAGLESTRASSATAMFVDAGNPFVMRSAACVIDGVSHPLAWRPLPLAEHLANVRASSGSVTRETRISDFSTDGAWVRLGIFQPDSPEEARAFHAVIADAARIRNKSVIVLDVRGNGGGPYNWFMAFLRGLYGDAYADYYARARLAIRAVHRATPEILASYRASDAQGGAVEEPLDLPRGGGTGEDPVNAGIEEALKQGRPWYRNAATPLPRPTDRAPPNPVRAKVYVLTDYRCGSACISFVDELKLFPGVTQIGQDTFVDERTGTPLGMPLPSGNGRVSAATMTRDGRVRGDAVPQKPTYAFDGNIGDDAKVREWIERVVIPSDRSGAR